MTTLGNVKVYQHSRPGQKKGVENFNQDRPFCFEIKLHTDIIKKLTSLPHEDGKKNMEEALTVAVNSVNEKIDAQPTFDDTYSGSTFTACASCRLPNKQTQENKETKNPLVVFSAQLGDSGALLFDPKNISVAPKQLTSIHDGNNPDERKRIESEGGKFLPHPTQVPQTLPIYLNGITIMTRRMGSKSVRKKGLSCVPETRSEECPSFPREIIAATDGILFEKMPHKEILSNYKDRSKLFEAAASKWSVGNFDDQTYVYTEGLDQLEEGVILVVGVMDGHSLEGHNIAEFAIKNFKACYEEALCKVFKVGKYAENTSSAVLSETTPFVPARNTM